MVAIIRNIVRKAGKKQKILPKWLPKVYWGRCPRDLSHSAVVVFPFHPNQLGCGLVGVIEFKKKKKPVAAAEVVDQIRELVKELKNQTRERKFSSAWILQRSEIIKNLGKQVRECKKASVFSDLFTHKLIREDLLRQSENIASLIDKEERERENEGVQIPSSVLEVLNKELIALKDIVWSIQNECLANIEKVRELIGKNEEDDSLPSSQLIQEFRKVNFILNNIDRLEVRGRDSAGLSIMVTFPDKHALGLFFKKLSHRGLDEQLKERQRICDSLNGHICYHTRTITFTFKVCAEIGKLGDNIAALRRTISQDVIFPLAVQEEGIFTTIIAHTRWASVGMICEENCHPMNNEYQVPADLLLPKDGRSSSNFLQENKADKNISTSSVSMAPFYQSAIGILQVALNGDIDNYAELKTAWEERTGGRISERITTDTKIIPLQVEYYLGRGHDLTESFRRAVNDFEGSQAITLQSDLEPGRIFLALRGSGQSIFIGVAQEAYLPASEIYGFVEETTQFIKMDGEKEQIAGEAKTHGQIFILDADSSGELSGMRAMSYNGQSLPLSAKDIQSTEITSRDIDRRGYPHYFLKEITESPLSVKKTILGKVDLVSEKDIPESKRVVFNLGEEIIPANIEEAFRNKKINNIYMVGQGTAGVAAEGIAMLFKEYLQQSGIQIAEQKASELSGFCLDGNITGTLVIAVTQSGTTTDTNKAVDMARNAGAYTLAIVNRRDSDITYKVDGVFYTSDGRDIEMSVASTKAFYSQVVAGCLLGLRLAQIMGLRSEEYLIREIRQLKRLPRLMTQILRNTGSIAASARKWALSKRYWAVVGSGPNKVAADEIRIKLSELCYKTLPADVVEDRKHIDLSAEPLVLVCAAGSRDIVLGDIIKDVAIFKAHKAVNIVLANEGEQRFASCADSLIHIPKINEHLSPILNTLAGHLWGYYAALSADEEANFLKGSRQLLNQKIADLERRGYIQLEIVFDRTFQDLINDLAFAVHQKNSSGAFNSAVKPNTISDLILLLKYGGGKLPLTDLEKDFQMKRGISNFLPLLQKALDRAINELSRPIDAIKHQAKTVTVGTSRLPEMLTGHIFDTIQKVGIPIEQITPYNLSTVKQWQSVVQKITGYTLYEVNQLDHLGRPTEKSTISLMAREGKSLNLTSRVKKESRLRGRKRSIITTNNAFIGLGASDHAQLVIIPAQGKDIHQKLLLLFHIEFEEQIPLQTKIIALGTKYDDLVDALDELNITWKDEFLYSFSTADLFLQSENALIETIRSQLGEGNTFQAKS